MTEPVLFQDIALGAYHSLALSVDNQVYSTGLGQNGQLGFESKSRVLFTHVKSLDDQNSLEDS